MNSPGKSEGRTKRSGCLPKWKHGKTCTIRIPEVFKSLILEIAKELDESKKPVIEFDSILKHYKLSKSKSIYQRRLDLSEVLIYEAGGHKSIRLEQLIPALQKHLDSRDD